MHGNRERDKRHTTSPQSNASLEQHLPKEMVATMSFSPTWEAPELAMSALRRAPPIAPMPGPAALGSSSGYGGALRNPLSGAQSRNVQERIAHHAEAPSPAARPRTGGHALPPSPLCHETTDERTSAAGWLGRRMRRNEAGLAPSTPCAKLAPMGGGAFAGLWAGSDAVAGVLGNAFTLGPTVVVTLCTGAEDTCIARPPPLSPVRRTHHSLKHSTATANPSRLPRGCPYPRKPSLYLTTLIILFRALRVLLLTLWTRSRPRQSPKRHPAQTPMIAASEASQGRARHMALVTPPPPPRSPVLCWLASRFCLSAADDKLTQ
ncbi:hypothetical protein Purlil1_3079 [Purpureocillium lilacinum]|uniref:Uncharacterized protein n=1 Tax=Purpureocillium lilacinum TaxID=33203 RepID=A0ABR0C7U3_PURLI|nr:hypothetical protein Purlil1_3079 [Purpureocillium lilacinum]